MTTAAMATTATVETARTTPPFFPMASPRNQRLEPAAPLEEDEQVAITASCFITALSRFETVER